MLASLTLHQQGNLRVTWAPFDHIARTARLVIVGITPGRQQAENALTAFRKALDMGSPHSDALRLAKQTGSFSGSMRGSLVDMLNHIGAHRAFGVTTCAALFEPAQELAHFTSALRHPVFVGDANYNGAPGMLRHAILRSMIETHLAEEAAALPAALWLPLGPKPTEALYHLADRGLLDRDRILDGLPHPSGANGERIAYFLGRKDRNSLSSKTSAVPLGQSARSAAKKVDAPRERHAGIGVCASRPPARPCKPAPNLGEPQTSSMAWNRLVKLHFTLSRSRRRE